MHPFRAGLASLANLWDHKGMKPILDFLTPLAVVVVLVSASPAAACPTSAAVVALIHNEVPDRLPEGAVVLDVAFPQEVRPSSPMGTEARIRRVVHGAFEGSSILVRAPRRTSCHYPFSNGRSGLIVGHVREVRGTPVFHPIFVSRRNGFRLLR